MLVQYCAFHNCPLLSLSSAGRLSNLYSFDPDTTTWTLLSKEDSSDLPLSREGHGLTQDGGKLYVHGGAGNKGNAFAPSLKVSQQSALFGDRWALVTTRLIIATC
jgi:hypothetical protein